MGFRPVDVARFFAISTTTVRVYEEMKLIPPISRTKTGYRIYTNEHIAYYACVRDMLIGFPLSKIAIILQFVMNRNLDEALWIVNKAQAMLQQEKIISQKMMDNLLNGLDCHSPKEGVLSIKELSDRTGVPATTIRYWDRVELLKAGRNNSNNYWIYTLDDIKKVHVIYAIKYALLATKKGYSIKIIKEQLNNFDFTSKAHFEKLGREFNEYLNRANRNQIKSVAALCKLCEQVEANSYLPLI